MKTVEVELSHEDVSLIREALRFYLFELSSIISDQLKAKYNDLEDEFKQLVEHTK